MKKQLVFLLLSITILSISCFGQNKQKPQLRQLNLEREDIMPGAYQFHEYLPLLQGKRVALLVNQTSEVRGELLPDVLLQKGVNIVKIFSPEHGFRGTADAGAHVKGGVDAKTGLPIVSLYGKNKKPTPEQLRDIDVVLYDLQDVGVRFYTYISSLEYMLEACAANNKQLIVLDRPNPLGFIVDGPVLEKSFSSFVGMQPIPVVYGMTPGEYAQMLVGERWITPATVDLKVINCENYTHQSKYKLPVPPSPNLKNMAAIYLYPSLCFFEGTPISVGRGTATPFQQFGHPSLKNYSYTFTPKSVSGATNPPLKDKLCRGLLIAKDAEDALEAIDGKLQIKWLLDAYKNYPEKGLFFTSFFEKLAGTNLLQKQIQQGLSEDAIRKSWEADLDRFKKIRSKYLLYAE